MRVDWPTDIWMAAYLAIESSSPTTPRYSSVLPCRSFNLRAITHDLELLVWIFVHWIPGHISAFAAAAWGLKGKEKPLLTRVHIPTV